MTQGQQPYALELADELRPSMPHDVIKLWAAEARDTIRRQHARTVELEAQLEAIGAVRPMPWRWYSVDKDGLATLCIDREDAEKAAAEANADWPHTAPHRAVQLVEASAAGFTAADMAPASAQGFRDGVASLAASAGSEPVACMNEYGVRGYLAATLKCWHRLTGDEAAELVAMTQRLSGLYTHPSPPEGMVGGWISVEDLLPEPNVEVLCAGQGWGNPFVTACYYDDERREWYPVNTHWTDSTGSAQYPTHWRPLPPPPTTSAGSGKGE